MNSRFWVVLLVATLTAGGLGYTRGFDVAENRLQARLAHEIADRATGDRTRAEAVAEAERTARLHIQKEAARNAALAAELVSVRRQIVDERQSFNRRLSHAVESADAVCSGLPSEWVGLYNEATRSGFSRDSHTRAGNSPASGVTDATDAAGTTRTGIRGGTPMIHAVPEQVSPQASPKVSPKDVLVHIRDYGGYCRSLEAQLQHLIPAVTAP